MNGSRVGRSVRLVTLVAGLMSSAVLASLPGSEGAGLDIGTFPIDGAQAVVDGDTLRVKGIKGSLRLLALDCEETFKTAADRQAYAAGWDAYLRTKRGNAPRPVKMATPLGEDAKKFAQEFFQGVSEVRLERDHPQEILDYYNRHLAYVFAFKKGRWINFNVEVVRQGMSPYFTKYGRSRRFHRELVEAQVQAQAQSRGIWDPTRQHYTDYEERLSWWEHRAEELSRFENESNAALVLTREDTVAQLEQRLGEDVVVIGAVNDIRGGTTGPAVVKLARSRGNDLDVVFFDKALLESSGLKQNVGEFVRVRGTVTKYLDPHRQRERLQITVRNAHQVEVSSPAARPAD